MSKRSRVPNRRQSSESITGPSSKKPRTEEVQAQVPSPRFNPPIVATAGNAALVDADPPLPRLLKAVSDGISKPLKGDCVVYWMRFGDLRRMSCLCHLCNYLNFFPVADNRALSRASDQAQASKIPLIVIFVISPQDYIAHDRSARRIDFVLRNLAILKDSLSTAHIPLHVTTHEIRRTLPSHVLSLLRTFQTTHLFANIEYEVDELRRDIKLCELMKSHGIKPYFTHDRCVVEPGVVLTTSGKERKVYTVFTPYMNNWLRTLNGHLSHYLEDCPPPAANDPSIHDSSLYGTLFSSSVPDFVTGFELDDEDKETMLRVWPAGEAEAGQILQRFLTTKARENQLGDVDPLTPEAELSSKHSRIKDYDEGRDRGDLDTSSRISPYLSAGIISVRTCVRQTMTLLKQSHVDAGRTTGPARWVSELAWRDFYTCILAGFPRVSMGRPFLEKFADVKWEDGGDSTSGGVLQRWEEGRTGVPIIDAAQRCLRKMGWMHNRMRMVTAMYLVKDLMLDWRLGEKFFMRNLIDGDLASNNGGWQWSASTGTDASPYFRIFNPYSQSTKADPEGRFIRHWVPELAGLSGSELHNPSAATADRLGYPRPMVDHAKARDRAIRRYKNPGDE